MLKQKKDTPTDLFIPKPVRIVSIIQLCLAFTLLTWYAGQPFMGEVFSYKNKLSLYHNAIGIPQSGVEDQKLSFRNKIRFQQLDEEERSEILSGYQKLQEYSNRSFWTKITRSVHIVIHEIPLFEQGWIIFSVIVPLLLLLRIEGSRAAVWTLPALTAAYFATNVLYGEPVKLAPEDTLFPNEQYLIENYVQSPLSPHLDEQKQQLQKAWNLYLVKEWLPGVPSENEKILSFQVEQGSYNFHLARTKRVATEPLDRGLVDTKRPIYVLALFLFWNIYYACLAQKYLKPQSRDNQLLATQNHG